MKHQLELFKTGLIEIHNAIWLKVRVFIKRIVKWHRRSQYLKRKKWLDLARGEIMGTFEPFILKIYDDAISAYKEGIEQNEVTEQTTKDIKRFLEIELKSYIISKIN